MNATVLDNILTFLLVTQIWTISISIISKATGSAKAKFYTDLLIMGTKLCQNGSGDQDDNHIHTIHTVSLLKRQSRLQQTTFINIFSLFFRENKKCCFK